MFAKKMRLRTLMLMMSVGGILLTSVLLLSTLAIFQKRNIEQRLLENNLAYARKLADTTDRYLMTAQRELAYGATQITSLKDPAYLQAEVERLCRQSGFFNSVVIVGADKVIRAASPESLKMLGVRLQSAVSQKAIAEKKFFISAPYYSAAGNYIVFISQPLFNHNGNYIGYLGGSIYLQKESMLSDILGMHFYENKTNVSVVSGDGKMIFNRNPALVNPEYHLLSTMGEQLLRHKSGSFLSTDEQGKNLVGYASLKQANWRVIISATSESVSRILLHNAANAAWYVVAILLLTVTAVIFFAGKILAPLEKLAELTQHVDSEGSARKLAGIRVWYLEAERLKEALSLRLSTMVRRMSALKDETMTDTLTGLYNRRGFSSLLEQYAHTSHLCLIAIDIDHFKQINDKFGHAGGDAILVEIGKVLTDISAIHPYHSCRFGGEEFIILLPYIRLTEAAFLAESLRIKVAARAFAECENLTISLGVACFSDNENDAYLTLRQADLALYEAKRQGRNRVIVSQADGSLTGP